MQHWKEKRYRKQKLGESPVWFCEATLESKSMSHRLKTNMATRVPARPSWVPDTWHTSKHETARIASVEHEAYTGGVQYIRNMYMSVVSAEENAHSDLFVGLLLKLVFFRMPSVLSLPPVKKYGKLFLRCSFVRVYQGCSCALWEIFINSVPVG